MNTNTIPTSEYRTNNKFMPSLTVMTTLIQSFAFLLAGIRGKRFAALKEAGIEPGTELARQVDNDVWWLNHALVQLGTGEIKRRTGIRKITKELVEAGVLSLSELADIEKLDKLITRGRD